MRGVWWPVLTKRTWLTALLSLHLLCPVSSIKCLQCTSLKQRECETGDLSATPCTDPSDRYCTKYTGDTDGFVFRACSRTVKRQCEMTDVGGLRIHVCFHTCYTDGCNAAMTVTSLPVAILMLVALSSCVLVSGCFVLGLLPTY